MGETLDVLAVVAFLALSIGKTFYFTAALRPPIPSRGRITLSFMSVGILILTAFIAAAASLATMPLIVGLLRGCAAGNPKYVAVTTFSSLGIMAAISLPSLVIERHWLIHKCPGQEVLCRKASLFSYFTQISLFIILIGTMYSVAMRFF